MRSEDVLVLLKIIAIQSPSWNVYDLSCELCHSPEEIESSLKRLQKANLLSSANRPNLPEFRKFILGELSRLFPAVPGELTRGLLTGAKPGTYFTVGLPYSSIWVWPKEDGPDWGYAIEPLSPHCCFAALHDRKLRKLLGVVETLRVSGKEATNWAEMTLTRCGLF